MGGKGSGRKTKNNAALPDSKKPDERVFDEESGEEIPPANPDEPGDHTPEPEPQPATPTNFAAEPEPEPEPAPEEPRRETRGRPQGSTKKKKRRDDEENSPENITKLLLSVHQMLAGFLDIPELLLSQAEAEKLGDAVAEVEALYSDTSYISPEVRAWGTLLATGVIVYWPRWKTIKIRLEREAAKDIDVTPIDSAKTAAAKA